jgi:hypothetical protein
MKRITFAQSVLAKLKFTGTAALVLAFIAVMAACPIEDNPGNPGTAPNTEEPGPHNPGPGTDPGSGSSAETVAIESLDTLATQLSALAPNPDGPLYKAVLPAPVVINNRTDGSGVWATINRTVKNAGKYVILDLSACSVYGKQIESNINFPGSCMNIIKDNGYIKGIILPRELTSIVGAAFSGCSSLTSITIPGSVTSIGARAFSGCGSLASVTIAEGLASIGERAFYRCGSLASVDIPGSVTDIGDKAFSECGSLASVTIAEGLTSIGYAAFSGCSSLASVDIPNSVTSIGSDVFDGCTGLTSVTIGADAICTRNYRDGVAVEGLENIFDGCASLSAVTIAEANNNYSSIDGVVFNKDKTALIYCPQGRAGSYTIPAGVISIGDWAFEDCSALTSLSLPVELAAMFTKNSKGCSNLAVVLTGTGPLPAYAFVRELIGNYHIKNTSLTSVTVGDGITSIGARAFMGCSSLTSAIIGDGVTSMGDYVFWGCASLASVIIGDSVTSMGDHLFGNCTSLASVTIGAGVSSYETNSFYNTPSLERITVDPANVKYGSFDGVWYNKEQGSIIFAPPKISGSITIPEGISIQKRDFSSRASLTGINVDAANSDYSSIDGVLFDKQKKLLIQYPAGRPDTAYTIPPGVECIGEYSFEGCAGLTSVTIPNEDHPVLNFFLNGFNYYYIDGVSTIGVQAFSGCTGLVSVTIEGSGIYDHFKYTMNLANALLGIGSGMSFLEIAVSAVGVNGAIGNASHGFYDNAFPPESKPSIGGILLDEGQYSLKTMYLAGGAGTYTRSPGGRNWTKQ